MLLVINFSYELDILMIRYDFNTSAFQLCSNRLQFDVFFSNFSFGQFSVARKLIVYAELSGREEASCVQIGLIIKLRIKGLVFFSKASS